MSVRPLQTLAPRRYGEHVQTTPQFVRWPALISAAAAPVFFIGGTLVAEALWPAFDPVQQTISELAAGDAPTRVFMTLMFALTGVSHLVTSIFAVGIGRPGRVALGLAGLATIAVATFPLPTVATSSTAHTLSAMAGFVLLAVWPVLGMRRSREYPWLLRPVGAVLSTLILGGLCLWFLAVWTSDAALALGVSERAAANLESLWPLFVVIALAVRQRRAAR